MINFHGRQDSIVIVISRQHYFETVSAYDQLPWHARLNCDCDQQAALVRDCYTYVQAKKIS